MGSEEPGGTGPQQPKPAEPALRFAAGRSVEGSGLPPDLSIPVFFAQATDLSIIAIDSSGTIVFVNPSALALFGYEAEEMVGKPISIIIPQRLQGAHNRGLARVAEGAAPNLGGKTVEVYARRQNDSEFPIEITVSVWTGSGGIVAAAVIKDISERREREARLLRLASQDTLTGLLNRQRFEALLAAELESASGVTVFMIDLDGFKDVNDTHGHAMGDALLQAVSVRLPYTLDANAQVARLGGDEFAVMLPGMHDISAAQAVAARITEALSQPYELGGQSLDVVASVGFAVNPLVGGDAAEIVASADFALHRAKASGGRRYCMFEPSMRNESHEKRILRDALLQALRQGHLEMHYQPQVDLASGAIFGLEALIRWRHPVRGLLLPGLFLPALDQSSLALEIGWWTLDQACAQVARLSARLLRPVKIGVNLFPGQVRAANLCMKVSEALARHAIDPALLELEVTETATLHDDDRSLESLTALRKLGVGIAFDDFGTGFASLSTLQRYPLTTLKIDRAFIRDMLESPKDAAITRALITLSSDLGLQTIAEGVETPEQEAALKALHCPAAQGYFYGRPMPAGDLDQLLEQPAIQHRA